jgi:endoglucanase
MLSKYTQPTTSWKDIYIPLSDFISQNTKLNLSRVSQIAILGSGSYTQSNKMLIATLEVVPSIANPFVDAVKLNQIGYVSNQKKMVIVSYESGAGTIIPSSFSIVNTKTNNAVFTGTLTQKIAVNPAQWGQDGDDVYQGDFSSFTTPGTYKIVVSDYAQQSQPFVISDSAYNKVFRDALRFFYYCRSGEAIVEPYAEGFTRNSLYEGGTAATYDYKTGTRDVKGGWFDAGDMHLDTHAPLASVWWLLETLKDDENKVPSNSLNIPGTKNGVSDLYALIKFELDWYKKMANPDGSVQFWVEQQINQTIPTLSDVTTSAAAILTGLFSKAYPLFKKQPAYSAYADTLLIMSQNSWQWLSAHTANINPINPKTNQPYPYENDDKTDNAMRFFAAVNLFNATGNAVYNTYIVSHFSDPLLDFDNQAWGGIMNSVQTTKSLGYMDYVNSAQPAVVVTIVQRLKTEFIKNADWTLDRIGYTAYNIPMAAPNHLFWGSTSYILCYAYEYKKAFEWTSNVKYRDAISNAIDWALGRNPANRIFVTGYGDDFHGTDLYSFYWNDIYKAPPGYMCGNINENELIPLIKKPWKRFINTQDAALLEPGIYWNAQFAWAMGYMASAKTATLVSQSISLQKGWNIISINIQPSDSSIATIFNGLDVQEIKTTDAFWRNGQPYAFNGLQSIAPGKGYLVNMNSTGTLNVIGSPLLSGLPAIKTGLNLIGCPFQSATPLSGLFSATNCSMIKNFDGFWIPNGTTNSILNLETGKGYFIIGK